MAAGCDNCTEEVFIEELRKKDIQIEKLTMQLKEEKDNQVKLKSLQQKLESSEEWLAEAMTLNDELQQQLSATQAQIAQLEIKNKELQSFLSHSLDQEKLATDKEELGDRDGGNERVVFEATETMHQSSEDITASMYHSAMLQCTSTQLEAQNVDVKESADLPTLEEGASALFETSSNYSNESTSVQAAAALHYESKSLEKSNGMMIKTFDRDEKQHFEVGVGFALGYRHKRSYVVCLRCFHVLEGNYSTTSLRNHIDRAICNNCQDTYEARMNRIRAEFQVNLAKHKEKQMAEQQEMYFVAKGRVVFKQAKLTKKAVKAGISFLEFFALNETLDSPEQPRRGSDTSSMSDISSLPLMTNENETLPNISIGFTPRGSFVSPVLSSTLATVEERKEEEGESSLDISNISSNQNDTIVKKN